MTKKRIAMVAVTVFLVCTLTTSVFANTSVSIGEMVIEKDNAFDRENAILYALAPEHLLPFIYSGNAPYYWLEIDTTGCEVGRLYIYNANTDEVSAIGDDTVTTYATTQEHVFYVTEDQKIIQTDYAGTDAVTLYTAQCGEITKLLTFGQYLSFVEGKQKVVVYDVPARTARTVLTADAVLSAYMLDVDQLIWIDGNGEQFCLNLQSGENTPLFDNQKENENDSVNADGNAVLGEDAGIYSTTTSTGDSYNDVTFPFAPYMAELRTNWDTSGISKRFSTRYADAGECDGFAKFAHDRFWHLEDWNRIRPSWQTVSNTCTDDYTGATPAQMTNIQYDPNEDNTLYHFTDATSVRNFFNNLTKGSFVRYFKTKQKDPNSVYNGVHSIVFDRITSTGIIVYEANQDWDNGVSYQLYEFDVLAGNYAGILYDVTHDLASEPTCENATYHTVECNNCDGFLRQAHTGTVVRVRYNSASHKVIAACCSGYVLQAHTFSNGICTGCGYAPTIGK